MQATSSTGSWTYYDFAPGAFADSYFITLPDHTPSQSRLQVQPDGSIYFVPDSFSGTWVSFRFTEVDDSVQLRKRNATGYALDGSGSSSNGQNVYLWSHSESNQNQHWEEIDRGGGYYTYQKAGTNFSLDGGNGGANGQNVYLWSSNQNNQNQHWIVE